MLVSSNRGTVLIVEDDRATAEFVETVLSAEGYRVELSHNGEEALHYMEREHPALLLLDLLLPVMDGATLLRTLRLRWRRSFPVILMTAGRDGAEQASILQVDGLLLKPFELDDLLSQVQALVGEPCLGVV